MAINTIDKLTSYWGKNGQKGVTSEYLTKNIKEKHITLPKDFNTLYKNFDGMKDQDDNGFFFMEIANLRTMRERFNLETSNPLSDIIIFVDYMIDCWWYGIKVYSEDSYEIGIIPDAQTFIKITNNLGDFLQLYIEDSSILYTY